jgi:hypothetical protein
MASRCSKVNVLWPFSVGSNFPSPISFWNFEKYYFDEILVEQLKVDIWLLKKPCHF